jgi:hypothetical protein
MGVPGLAGVRLPEEAKLARLFLRLLADMVTELLLLSRGDKTGIWVNLSSSIEGIAVLYSEPSESCDRYWFLRSVRADPCP